MGTQLQKFDMAMPIGSLEAYMHWVNQVPMLTETEELELANRLQREQDLEAARKLVMSHLRFVVRVAKGYSGYGLPQGDLIQEGNVGLMKAVKRFDPSVGVRLVSFAVHWIKAEIHEFILRNWRIVKVATTKAQRKAFFNLRKMKERLGWFTKEEVEGVAEELGVKPEVIRVMEQRLSAYDLAFDAPDTDDSEEGGGSSFAPVHFLEDKRANPANIAEEQDTDAHYQNDLSTAMVALDSRSQDILTKRWLTEKKATLHELATEHNVSAERIRQIERGALAKLRSAMELSQ